MQVTLADFHLALQFYPQYSVNETKISEMPAFSLDRGRATRNKQCVERARGKIRVSFV